MSQIEDFLGDKPSSQPKSGGDIDSFLSDAPKSYGLKDFGGDLASVVTKGVMAVPQALVGLADIATSGQAGKALENAGVRFNEANQIADSWKSDSLKAQQKEFQDAQGIGGKAVAALSNPGLVASTVAESIPSMFLGGALAKGIGLAAPALAGRAGLTAAGEGLIGAGSLAESVRQQTPDGLLTPTQSALAAGAGVATAGLGALGARAGKALGVGDIDSMIANGATQGVAREGMGLASRVGRGALSEGVLEELPQSLSETAFENVALGKPVTEGMDEAAVLGTLSGGLMGGVAGGLSRPAKPSQQMGIDPNAGPLSRAAAASVDSQPAPQLGFSPLAGTPIIYPDGSVALNSEQEFQKRNPGVQQGMDLSKIAQPSQPLAAEKKVGQPVASEQKDAALKESAPVAPVSESVPLEQRSLDELRQAFRSAQEPAIRKTLAAEIRKRREAMPDPLAPVQPQQEIALEPQAPEAVQSQPQEAQAEPTKPVALGQPLTDAGTNLLGRGADPLQSIIQGQADARRAADELRGTTGASTVTGGDITPSGVESPVADVRSGGRNDDAGTAQPDANGDAGRAVGSAAEGSAALRPEGWRTTAIKAGKVARSLGLDPKGKRLKEIVAEIDAADAGSGVAAKPASREQAIRDAWRKEPRTIGKWTPISVEAEGQKADMLVNQKRAGGDKDGALHVVNIRMGKMLKDMEREPIAYTYRLTADNRLVEEGVPSVATPGQIAAWKGAGFALDDKQANVKNTPQGTAGEAKAPSVEASKAEGGNAASSAGVPAAGDTSAVENNGVKSREVMPAGLTLEVGGKLYPVDSLAQASEMVSQAKQKFTEAKASGKAGGFVEDAPIRDGAGRIVGYVGRGGSVFDVPNAGPRAKKLYDAGADLAKTVGEAEAVTRPALPKPAAPGAGDVQADGVKEEAKKDAAPAAQAEKPAEDDAFMGVEDDAPIFYSALRKEIEGLNLKSAPFLGWHGQLQGLVRAGKVKADELEWTGITEWLKLQTGKVSKEDVLAFLDANGVQVTETVLGDEARETASERWMQERARLEFAMPFDSLDEADQDYIRGKAEDANIAPDRLTKYSQYTLPGGENYREVLLTLPVRSGNRLSGAALEEDRFVRELMAKYGADVLDNEEASSRMTDEEANKLFRLSQATHAEFEAGDGYLGSSEIQTYESSHWDQKNVLAHIRVNDRVDADGKRVLFVEELQSDMAQDKRRGKTDFAGPFIDSTDKWLALSLKRIMKMAVDGGYDAVAFVNGEQSADRYDLSKQVEELMIERDGDAFVIAMKPVGQGYSQGGRWKGGVSELPDVVGKELADKVAAQPEGRSYMRGLDLKVGGEGMKAFYDKIVPTAVKDVLKKVGGGQMESVSIGGTEMQNTVTRATVQGREEWRVWDANDNVIARFQSEKEAADYIKNQGGGGTVQPGFTITDSMREKVAGGLPLFAGTKDKSKRQGTPVDRAIMDMAGEGREANEILSFIAKSSKSPYRRQLAQRLLATGANPAVSLGGEMGGGAGFRFLAKYSRKNHEVTLSEAAADRAEQIFLHETVHAATLLALDKGGLIATQMRRLASSVYKDASPEMRKMYGLVLDKRTGEVNVGEFVAEAFTNPEFQKALKGMKADNGSLWDRLVNIVRRILGMEPRQQDALSKALELGAGVMRENVPLRAAKSFRSEDAPAPFEEVAGRQLPGTPSQNNTEADGILDAHFGIADAVEQIKAFDVKEAPKNTWAHYRGMALQALGRRQLVDLYGDEFGTHLHEYDTLVQQMDAEKNETGAEADDIAQRWGKLKDEKALAELMHDATLAKMDPDKPMPAGYSKAEYDKLKTRFSTLSPEAKTLYREARDMYVAHYKAVQQAIKDRIERSEMSPSEKKRMMASLDDKLFKELEGVYFPLARFGQYVIVVKDANGEVKNVTRAETVKEAEQARKELQKAFPAHMGNTVGKVLKQAEFNAGRDAVGKGFMADLMSALDEKGVDDELRDTVAQLYLSSLPDLSWAKHGIHRKGTPGFSQDARRAFAQNAFHGARYLAKLRYSDQLQDELSAMQEYVKAFEGVDEYDSIQGQQVVDEMVKRHEILMNPKSSPVSTALTSFGFLFHMGLSPASAMVNLTQTALVAFPQMGAKWGFTKAGAALTKASEEVVRAKNDLSKALKGDELAAFDRAVKDGTIDVTMAHDLAGIAQGEDQGVMWKVRPVMRWASFMFHHAEKFNRQATFLAAFRLSKETNPGRSEDWHYEEAKKATYDGHFDYSAANRARIMQGNWQRVILLFKQYSQSMIYTLARNAYQSVKAIDPKERAQARKTLGGILAAHAAAAGVLGLPIVGPLLTVASWIGGDDDEPWDAEVAMQNAMAEMIGPKAAEVVARGFSRLTPFDLSGRVALNKLILPDVQEGLEGKEWAESAMAAALGPVAGIGVNMARGAQKITEGDYLRGMEDMMPTALRGPLKALRYANEGAVDKTGVVITDEVSAAGVLGQASGFSPSQVRRDTERRSAIYAYDRALLERRSVLMRMMAEARIQGDAETAAEVQKDIQRFNEKNPTRRITPMNIAQSVRNRRKRIDEAEQGVYLPSKRRDALDAVSF